MGEYLAPGVFVEEIDSGSKPLEGVGVNMAAFVGYARSGKFDEPVFISNWGDFCREFGEDDDIVIPKLCDETGWTPAQALQAKRDSKKSLAEFVNDVLSERFRKTKSGAKSWDEFVKQHDLKLSNSPFMDGSYLAYAVRGYYDNGGGRAYVVRVARAEDLALYDYESRTKAMGAGVASRATLGGYTFKALDAGKKGDDISVDVTHVGEENGFTLKVKQGNKVESIGTNNAPLTPQSVSEEVKSRSKLIEVTVDTAVADRPAANPFNLMGGLDSTSADTAIVPLQMEIDKVVPEQFEGDEAKRTGVRGLSLIEDLNMIMVPDLMAGLYSRVRIDDNQVGPEVLNKEIFDSRRSQILATQKLIVDYCERMGDRMCILDPLPDLNAQEMMNVVVNESKFSSDHGQGTIYYPWVKVVDQVHKGRNGEKFPKLVPPCGHVAGTWARVATERGVHKAPANEALMGVVGLARETTKGEQEILNPEGINCIRSFPGTGIRIWGARTLATRGNPSWKYVNVRRLFNYLERTMDRGLQWVVFEPNDHDLWGRVRRNLSAFLYTEWKEGKLFGRTPEEAFYVKCDEETNPKEMIDLGRLYVEIGVNPVKPAEFVIIRIGQWSGGGETNEA